MKRNPSISIAAFALVVALSVPLHVTAQQMRYNLTDVGTLGGTYSQADGINNRGSVAGFASPPGHQDFVFHAFGRGA